MRIGGTDPNAGEIGRGPRSQVRVGSAGIEFKPEVIYAIGRDGSAGTSAKAVWSALKRPKTGIALVA